MQRCYFVTLTVLWIYKFGEEEDKYCYTASTWFWWKSDNTEKKRTTPDINGENSSGITIIKQAYTSCHTDKLLTSPSPQLQKSEKGVTRLKVG